MVTTRKRGDATSAPVEPSARFTVLARARSFRFALAGLWFMFRTQHNAWIHLSATLATFGAGLWLQVSAADWRWLIAAMALVWTAEAMNTAFEHLCDVVSPQFHAGVQRCKDIAAGAVLICAIAAVLLGAATLWPYIA
jgi:diacylglycerol kinase (ATP)